MTLMVSDMNGLIIDCFAGGGGASKGIELALNRPIDIAITHDYDGKPYPIKEQVARIGNSVVPIMAKALVQANCPHLIKEAMTA